MILEVERLAASYAGVPALHDVSFGVEEGTVVSLIGSNGAGKTTAMRAISGQLRPDRGVIRFRGRRIDGQPAHRIATIRAIAGEGMTIVLVEQNVREALELADRAYVLQTGTTVAEGTGPELLGSDLVRRAYLGM